MKILITGGAGYIGSIMVPYLLNKGHEITVIDNFLYKQTSLVDCCINDNFTIVYSDVRDKDVMQKQIKDKDIIIPLAALVGAPVCKRDEIAASTVNFEAIKLIDDLRAKDQKVIYPTTNSGYGVGGKDEFCTEKTPLNPISLYGKTKVEAENLLLASKNAITLRLATVFGMSPRMRLDLLVNDFTYRAVTDRSIVLFESHFRRNFLHIRDAVRAFDFCIENFNKLKDEPYNVGLSEANLTKMQLCERIKKHQPDFHIFESEIGKDEDKRDYVVSNDKIESKGFKCEYGLDRGIKELIKGYQIIRKNIHGNV